MAARVPLTIAALVLGAGLCVASAQKNVRSDSTPEDAQRFASHGITRPTLSPDDGLSVIAAALDPKVRRRSGQDCSHLVHAIYARAGFPYAYANSNDLYAGADGFVRVKDPQPGDVVVWHGHVGIVVHPSHHVFFSFMRSGPGIDDYTSRYWVRRGHPRFYRYAKDDECVGCTSASARYR